MSSDNIQIVHAYENLGLSPEEIARELDLEVPAVKAVLRSHSGSYRLQLKDHRELFTAEDEELAAGVLRELMVESEEDSIRLKSAQYILDVKSGRLSSPAINNNTQVNITVINERMKNAREALRLARAKVINVPSNVKELIGV